MRLYVSDNVLTTEDDPKNVWIAAGLAIFIGLPLIVIPWVIYPGLIGKRVLAARLLIMLLGILACALGVRLFRRHPATRATFDKTQKKLVVRQTGPRKLRREIPFTAIEMMTVGQKEDDGGDQIYRMAVSTRSGERVPLSRWKKGADEMLDIARQIESWFRG
jgi:hypothetical protein